MFLTIKVKNHSSKVMRATPAKYKQHFYKQILYLKVKQIKTALRSFSSLSNELLGKQMILQWSKDQVGTVKVVGKSARDSETECTQNRK